MTSNLFDLIIVGAGPAGLAAGVEARKSGVRVLVLDEGLGVGGQVYRSIMGAGDKLAAILGPDYAAGRSLAATFHSSGVDYRPQTTVFMIERREPSRFLVGAVSRGRTLMVESRFVLIATGALERPFPIPGWTLPGVMTAGAAQTMLKASGTVPAGKVCLAGSGPLLYLLAAQYVRAGVEVSAVLDTTPWSNWAKALPFLPEFATTPYFAKGLRLMLEVARAVPVERGVAALEAAGDGKLTEVRYAIRRRHKSIEVDTLLLHQGVAPQVNLAMSVGALHVWNSERLAFEPRLDKSGQTTVPALFVAGDSAGIGGAEAAASSGKIAAIAIIKSVNDVGRSDPSEHDVIARESLARSMRGRRFLDRLYRPAKQFRIPQDDVVVCRCEEVRASTVRALTTQGAMGPNQLKAFSRAGMGPCQGRMCGLTVCEIMAEQAHCSPADIGYMNIRSPVKPIKVGELSQLYENEII